MTPDPSLVRHPENGDTALKLAAWNGHPRVVTYLVSRSAAVDEAGDDGNTALLLAASEGQTASVEVLVGAGADLTHANAEGGTAIVMAAANGHADCVSYYTSYSGSCCEPKSIPAWVDVAWHPIE